MGKTNRSDVSGGASVDQDLYCRCVVAHGGIHEWGEAVRVVSAHRRAPVEQRPHRDRCGPRRQPV